MAKWVLILLAHTYGAASQFPTVIEVAGREACEEAAKVATSDPKGFNFAICINTRLPSGTLPH